MNFVMTKCGAAVADFIGCKQWVEVAGGMAFKR